MSRAPEAVAPEERAEWRRMYDEWAVAGFPAASTPARRILRLLDALDTADAERDAAAHARGVEEERARCLAVARGCTDYSGGNRGQMLEAFHHGIYTVVSALSAPPDSLQVRTLVAIGDHKSGAALEEGDVTEDERMAAIGRAVVEHLMPGNQLAVRQATPELVIACLERQRDELRALSTCDALRVGRHVVALADLLRLAEVTP